MLRSTRKDRVAKLVLGIGHFVYPHSRHSVGYYLVDRLGRELKAKWILDRELYGWFAEVRDANGRKVVLAKPRTNHPIENMRLVRESLPYFKIDAKEQLVVVHHDMSMPIGQSKVLQKPFVKEEEEGDGFAEHFGLRDFENFSLYEVARATNTELFKRISIGIGPPKHESLVPMFSTYVRKTPMDMTQLYTYNKFPVEHQEILDKQIAGDLSKLKELLIES